MAKKKLVPSDTFFQTFIGERVTLMSKHKLSMVMQQEDSASQEEIPITFSGFLLDMDDVYYYLGSSPSAISDAIIKDEIYHIEIEQPVNPLAELLGKIDIPGEAN